MKISDVQAGQFYQDRDTRRGIRIVRVVKVERGYAYCENVSTGRMNRIELNRLALPFRWTFRPLHPATPYTAGNIA